MNEHGLRIDGLAAMHHEPGGEPRRGCPKWKRPGSTGAPEDGNKPAEKAAQGELFYGEVKR